MKEFFVTATDTDAGKTYVSQALIYKLVSHYKVAAFKPISAGCELVDNQLINTDAKQLTELANCGQSIEQVNPIAFEQPIAPHIAAASLNQAISIEDIQYYYDKNKQLLPDVLLTEGAGGWRLPLGNGHFLSEFAQQNQLAVILVVNMKLGCLNHAVLTYESIISDGLTCVGWVANCQQEMPFLQENISELTTLISAPLIGTLPFEQNISKAADMLDISALI